MNLKIFSITVLIMVLFFCKCVAGENENQTVKKSNEVVSIEELIELLNKPLTQQQFDNIIAKYKMVKENLKYFYYVSTKFGVVLVAHPHNPETFYELIIIVNTIDSRIFKGRNAYNGILPLGLPKNILPEDIIKRLNLIEYKNYTPQDYDWIIYRDYKNKLQYGFSFRNWKTLEEISIRKLLSSEMQDRTREAKP